MKKKSLYRRVGEGTGKEEGGGERPPFPSQKNLGKSCQLKRGREKRREFFPKISHRGSWWGGGRPPPPWKRGRVGKEKVRPSLIEILRTTSEEGVPPLREEGRASSSASSKTCWVRGRVSEGEKERAPLLNAGGKGRKEGSPLYLEGRRNFEATRLWRERGGTVLSFWKKGGERVEEGERVNYLSQKKKNG